MDVSGASLVTSVVTSAQIGKSLWSLQSDHYEISMLPDCEGKNVLEVEFPDMGLMQRRRE